MKLPRPLLMLVTEPHPALPWVVGEAVAGDVAAHFFRESLRFLAPHTGGDGLEPGGARGVEQALEEPAGEALGGRGDLLGAEACFIEDGGGVRVVESPVPVELGAAADTFPGLIGLFAENNQQIVDLLAKVSTTMSALGDFSDTTETLIGSRYFAAHQPPGYQPLYAVLFDMVGYKDLRLPPEGYSLEVAPEVVQLVWRKAKDLGHGDIFVEQAGIGITDDHLPLQQVGIRAINVIDYDYPYHHTTQDTLDKISAASLKIVGDVALALVR